MDWSGADADDADAAADVVDADTGECHFSPFLGSIWKLKTCLSTFFIMNGHAIIADRKALLSMAVLSIDIVFQAKKLNKN